MKKWIHLQFPIRSLFSWFTCILRRNFINKQQGSITLEAALIMPVLLLFLLLFYIFLMISSAQMALQATASATVQQISSNIHPIALVVNKWNANNSSQLTTDSSENEEGIRAVIYELSGSFPAPINQLLQESLKGNWWPAINLAGTTLGKDVLERYIWTNANYPVLEKDRVDLVYLKLPDLLNGTDQNVVLTLEYKLPLKIPFTNQPVTIREQAMQRAWLPDTKSASFEVSNEEEHFIDIVSLQPNPVRPGRKATLKVVTTPNTLIQLNIVYKSGNSTAKNLGIITSNENGEAEWTWHVSGNTTEGEWLFQISLPNEQYEVEQTFQVMKIK